MKDGLVLFYCKDDVIYPVALTEEQNQTLQFVGHLFEPIRLIHDRPQGAAIDLLKGRIAANPLAGDEQPREEGPR